MIIAVENVIRKNFNYKFQRNYNREIEAEHPGHIMNLGSGRDSTT